MGADLLRFVFLFALKLPARDAEFFNLNGILRRVGLVVESFVVVVVVVVGVAGGPTVKDGFVSEELP